MKRNTSKKLYDIIFNEVHLWSSGSFAKIVEKHATSKDEIKNIIEQRLKFSYKTNQYEVRSVNVKSHDIMDIKGSTFVSQDTEDLGEYTVLYPYQSLDQNYVAYAPDKNVIDLNLNLIQKAKQR